MFAVAVGFVCVVSLISVFNLLAFGFPEWISENFL